MKQNYSIEDVESKIQLALVMSIFFPTFLDGISISPKTTTHIKEWSVLVGLYLADYFFFQVLKNKFSSRPAWLLKWLNIILLCGIAAFIFPILFLSTVSEKMPELFWGKLIFATNIIFLKLSIWGLFLTSLGSLLLIIVSVALHKKQL